MLGMAEWTERFLRALRIEEPSFCAGRSGGIAAGFDVRIRWDEHEHAVAAIDRRTRLPAPPSAPIELTFTPDDDPRSAAVAVAVVARM
ncbi:MAG: hypothetical protein NVSMB64_15330 [Candidatus Velthaea sp.]